MLRSKLNLIASCGLVVFCGFVPLCSSQDLSQTSEALPASWGEVRTAVSTLLDQDKFDEALALIERLAPELQGREFEISDLTTKILFGAGHVDEAMTVWGKGLEEGFFYFIVPRSATYDAVRRSDRFKEHWHGTTGCARRPIERANRNSK